MENGMKSVDDIAMAAINVYFQADSARVVKMNVEAFAELFTHAYYDARKAVIRVVEEQKQNPFKRESQTREPTREERLAAVEASVGEPTRDLSFLDSPDYNPGYWPENDLGEKFK